MDDYSYNFDEMTRQWINEERLAIQMGLTDADRARLESEAYAKDLVERGHCPMCLTMNCSGHGI